MKNNKLLIEKLQSIYEYDKEFFTYDVLEKDLWTDKIREAMDKFKIHFDLENNDSCKSQREIEIPQSYWDHTECKFKCEMWSAGGDWEVPVRYFKIQLIKGYCYNDDKIEDGKNYVGRGSYGGSHFVFIPGKTEGNYQLVSNRKNDGNWSAPDNNEYKENIDPKANERDCWESLEEYLRELVRKEIEHVRTERSGEQ